MASKSLGVLTLDLVAKIGGFEQGMDRAARHADKRMRDIEARANKFGKVIGTAMVAGASAALAGLVAVTKAAIDSADRINDISQRLGVSTEALSAWGYAAQQSGTDLEALNGGLTRFTKNVAAAMDAGSRQAEIFAALGIEIKDAAGNLRSVEDLVPEVATKFKEMNNATQESALSMELFGKSGAQLLQFLNLGSDGLSEMEQRARDLGIVISGETAQAADDFNDSLADLKAIASGLGLQLAQELLPALLELIAQFKQAIQEGGAVAKVVEFIGDQASAAVSDLQFFAQTFEDIGHVWDAITLKGQAMKELLTFNLAEARRLNAAGAAAFAAGVDSTPDSAGRRTTPIPNLSVPGMSPLFGGPSFSAVPLPGLGAPLRSSGTEAALNRVFTNTPKPKSGGGGRGGGKNDAADALREQARAAKEAEEELARLVKQEADARDAFESMAASLAGPLADANFQFIKDQERLNELAKEGAIGADELAIAQDNLREAHEKNVEAINAQLTPAEEVIAGLREEIELIGMSDIAQQKLIATRQAGAEATAEQVDEIGRLIEAREQAAKAADLQREFETGLADAMYDAATGAKEAGDAVKDFFDDLGKYILKMIFEGWAKKIAGLFSGQGGESGSGGSGTNWFSLIAGMFGGGKAAGGTVSPNTMYRVNENGTEMLSIGGRDYLMMGSQAGRVTPNNQITSGGRNLTQNVNVTIAGRPDRRTPDQVARAAGREARREMSRTGA